MMTARPCSLAAEGAELSSAQGGPAHNWTGCAGLHGGYSEARAEP